MKRSLPSVMLFALALVTAQQACRRSPDADHSTAVKALLVSMDTMQARLDAIDTAALAHRKELFGMEREGIEARFRDTLRPDEALILGNYHRAMSQVLPQVMIGIGRAHSASDSTRHRLNDLAEDVEHAALSREAEASAVASETAIVQRTAEQIDLLCASAANVLRTNTQYRSAVDTLLRVTPPAR